MTRTITNEDDPHISAHGIYQLSKTTTNSGLVMRSIWPTKSLVLVVSRQALSAFVPVLLVRTYRVGLINPRDDPQQQTATFLGLSLRQSSGSLLRILGRKFCGAQ